MCFKERHTESDAEGNKTHCEDFLQELKEREGKRRTFQNKVTKKKTKKTRSCSKMRLFTSFSHFEKRIRNETKV